MNENSFIGYEYKDVTVRRDMEALYTDSFPSFGWQPEGRMASLSPGTAVTLKFKRNRRIANKAELTRLQREFERHISEIEKLEDSKMIMPSAAAYSVGIIGTALMAGSVFAVTAAHPIVPLCIVLAIPGFIGWVIPYFLFNRMKQKRTSEAMPLIDSKYDAIYEICDKACRLSA